MTENEKGYGMTENKECRTLTNNKIAQFILRIDFVPANFSLACLKEAASKYFDQNETTTSYTPLLRVEGTRITLEQQAATTLTYYRKESRTTEFQILVEKACIALQSSQYIDSNMYRPLITTIQQLCKEGNVDIRTARIGLRFINNFPCTFTEKINKILNKPYVQMINGLLTPDTLSRTGIVSEFKHDGWSSRLQLGVFNDIGYPGELCNHDITVDIDSFAKGWIPVEEWMDYIDNFNHGAYDLFTTVVHPSLIEKMR